MHIDTDVLIWYFRGNEKAKRALERLDSLSVSSVVYMGLLQGVRDKTELAHLKHFFIQKNIAIHSINASIDSRSIYFIEKYALSHGLRLADALIAATADIHGETLFTANAAHYRIIPSLSLKIFKP